MTVETIVESSSRVSISGQESLREKYGVEINADVLEQWLFNRGAEDKRVKLVITENPFFTHLMRARSIQRQLFAKRSLGECSMILNMPGEDVILFSPSVAKENMSRVSGVPVENQNEEDTKWIFERYLSRTAALYADINTASEEFSKSGVAALALTMGGAVIALGGAILSDLEIIKSKGKNIAAITRLAAIGIGTASVVFGMIKSAKAMKSAHLLIKNSRLKADRHTQTVIQGHSDDELVSFCSEE